MVLFDDFTDDDNNDGVVPKFHDLLPRCEQNSRFSFLKRDSLTFVSKNRGELHQTDTFNISPVF